jgi:hypothetical protein
MRQVSILFGIICLEDAPTKLRIIGNSFISQHSLSSWRSWIFGGTALITIGFARLSKLACLLSVESFWRPVRGWSSQPRPGTYGAPRIQHNVEFQAFHFTRQLLIYRVSFRNRPFGIEIKLRLGLPTNHILRFFAAAMAALGLTEPPFRDAGSVGLT